MILIEYPKCSTCRKAKDFLEKNNIKFEDRNIVTNNPTEEELQEYILKSNKDVNKFFNTSGLKYRELDLKNKLQNMTNEDKIKLLSTDGMLVKRPILVSNNQILIGFKESEWEDTLLKN